MPRVNEYMDMLDLVGTQWKESLFFRIMKIRKYFMSEKREFLLHQIKNRWVGKLNYSMAWKIIALSRKIKGMKIKRIGTLLLRKCGRTVLDYSLLPRVKYDDTKEEYVQFSEKKPIYSPIKAIAFYLPQFHPFRENDEWWGKGFTEWVNVTKARPVFDSHYQPHLPVHFGFYDLRIPEVMEEQARVARNYGIYGFNYYFYWFDGETIMEYPLNKMLENKNMSMPFCLTWANENWTRRWDGSKSFILKAQKHSLSDHKKFIKYIQKYFLDDRYIKIAGKPILIIYKAYIIPEIKRATRIWRQVTIEAGFPDLYLVCAETFRVKDPYKYGFDAAMEFPPHIDLKYLKKMNTSFVQPDDLAVAQPDGLDKSFIGDIFSYKKMTEFFVCQKSPGYRLFKTAMLGWDNTPRMGNEGTIFTGFSQRIYKQWLNYIANEAFHDTSRIDDEKIIFINAWNEWAEGTHLEPDRKYGFGYLASTYDVLKKYDNSLFSHTLKEFSQSANNMAFVFHIHYKDEMNINKLLERVYQHYFDTFDIYVTSSSPEILDTVKFRFTRINTLLVENRGRDILPFIKILQATMKINYRAVCKVHGKKSSYRTDGHLIAKELLDDLTGDSHKINMYIRAFAEYPDLGMICPSRYFIKMNDKNMLFNRDRSWKLCKQLGIRYMNYSFPAGAMFWFRPSALQVLSGLGSHDFDLESGLSDGTTACAVERLFALCAVASGFSVLGTKDIQLKLIEPKS